MLKPELKIKSPPTIDNSQKNAFEIYLPKNKLKTKIEPCHKNNTSADHIIPIPYAQDRIIEVIKSNVAFVYNKVASPYNAL